MEANFRRKQIYEEMNTLHRLLGEAVWMIQHLEDALSHSIAIKNPEATIKAEGDKILSANRKLTLGKAIKQAKKEKVYSEDFQNKLRDFLDERNWLIHKCMRESVDEIGVILDKDKLFRRIKGIGLSAQSLTETITIDMMEFTTSNGKDVRKAVREEYLKWAKINGLI